MPEEFRDLGLEDLSSLEDQDKFLQLKEKYVKYKKSELRKIDKYNRRVYFKLRSMKKYIPKPKKQRKELFEFNEMRVFSTQKEIDKFRIHRELEEAEKEPDDD